MKSFDRTLDKFLKINQKLESSLLIAAVRRGLTGLIPLLLIGSFALIFLSLPIPGYQDFMARLFGISWSNFFEVLRDGTFNILSLFMVLFISHAYHTEYSARKRASFISPLIGSGVALCSFIIVSTVSKDGFSILNFGTTNVSKQSSLLYFLPSFLPGCAAYGSCASNLFLTAPILHSTTPSEN